MCDARAVAYLPTLDGLRGVAILLVLWYHTPFLFQHLPEFAGAQSAWSMLGIVGMMSLGGWIGVDLFFVISGFLITSILIRVRDRDFSSFVFWGRRALRIFPLAGMYLLVLFSLTLLDDPLRMMSGFDGWSWYVFYLGNIHITIYGWQPLGLMILWSLAIEEQFYLVWPLLMRMVSATRLIWWIIGLIFLAPLVRAVMFSTINYPATYVFTLCRIDALAAGALMSVLLNSHEWRQKTFRVCECLLIPALGLILLTLLVPFSPSLPQTRPWFFSVFGYSLLAASFAVCLVASLKARALWYSALTSPFLTFVGRRCYGLYVWHVLVASMITAVLQPFQIGFYGHVMLWLIALLVVASGSWVLLEEPMLRLKDLIPYEKKRKAKFKLKLAQVQ
jgi:peptidoglycan/LPS O-acetylase OafA/YrhL